MTTKVIVSVPEGEKHSVVVRTAPEDGAPWPTSLPCEVLPGASRECLVWAGQALHIEEKRDGGGE